MDIVVSIVTRLVTFFFLISDWVENRKCRSVDIVVSIVTRLGAGWLKTRVSVPITRKRNFLFS